MAFIEGCFGLGLIQKRNIKIAMDKLNQEKDKNRELNLYCITLVFLWEVKDQKSWLHTNKENKFFFVNFKFIYD